MIKVWRIPETWHPYPWRFSVVFKEITYSFAGIPNQCETKRSATMRAVWRLRWLKDGSYHKRYISLL